MTKKKKPDKPKIRINWGNVKPGTKVIPDKKKPKPLRKEKHKGELEN